MSGSLGALAVYLTTQPGHSKRMGETAVRQHIVHLTRVTVPDDPASRPTSMMRSHHSLPCPAEHVDE